MSLPPALLARLAQRGLVQKQQKAKEQEAKAAQPAENEEVIAEDYDEMDSEQDHGPEVYPELKRKPAEENFWIERIKARMGESTTAAGHKGCPNKYNIWHKCTLFCVNRWEEGHPEPSRDYLRRYKRLRRKYPLPKGWTEMYDPGCGSFYFYSASENLVSWLPPTHPNSQVSKSAAVLRRQLEDETLAGGNGGSKEDSDGDEVSDGAETASARHQREVDDIISSSMPGGRDYRVSEDTENSAPRKQKSRDLDRIISRQRERERERDRGRDRDYDRERERNRERPGYGSSNSRRNYGREEADILDPMDPSAYSDTPRGKWSAGLNTGGEEQAPKSAAGERGSGAGGGGRDRRNRERDRDRRKDDSDDDEDEEDYH